METQREKEREAMGERENACYGN